MKKAIPLSWRLSGFYFFFFAVAGVMAPYWSLYLKSLGFEATAIGELTAVYIGGSFFAPYLWAWIADQTGKSIILIRLTSVLSVFTFAGVLGSSSFWPLALLLCGFSFLLNGILPQLEANTLNHAAVKGEGYGHVRLWGSVGFVITAIILGQSLDSMNINMIPKIALILLIMTALMTFFIPEYIPEKHPQTSETILHLLTRPVVIAFMTAAFMMFIGYSPYIIFFSIYLEENHYSRSIIGWLWALGMLAEIAAFFLMSRLLSRYSFKALLIFSYTLTGIRWLLIAFFIDSIAIVAFSQLLQAASIGIYHTVSIHVIRLLFKDSYQYRGQAAYACVTGTAGVVGILGSGYLWDYFPASVNFSLAALATVIALIITWCYVESIEYRPIDKVESLAK